VALGAILGAVNGYLVAGSIMFFMHIADYPFTNIVTKPEAGSALETTVITYMQYMPPHWLGEPLIYFAVFIVFGIVLAFYL
jgi:hypothetical protein